MNAFKLFTVMALTTCMVFTGQAEVIGKVKTLTGSASVLSDINVTGSLYPGAEINLNDTISTDRGSSVMLEMPDGTTIEIGANASMLIDEYVYDPSKKSENRAHLKLFKGLFKVATDKITKLNPERFKVSTRSGTVGIRGCEVIFDLTGDVDKVFVVDIHDVESVEVFLTEFSSAFNGIKEISITEDGKGVILSEDGGLTTFNFKSSDLPLIHALISVSTPASTSIKVETSDPVIERKRADRYIDELF